MKILSSLLFCFTLLIGSTQAKVATSLDSYRLATKLLAATAVGSGAGWLGLKAYRSMQPSVAEELEDLSTKTEAFQPVPIRRYSNQWWQSALKRAFLISTLMSVASAAYDNVRPRKVMPPVNDPVNPALSPVQRGSAVVSSGGSHHPPTPTPIVCGNLDHLEHYARKALKEDGTKPTEFMDQHTSSVAEMAELMSQLSKDDFLAVLRQVSKNPTEIMKQRFRHGRPSGESNAAELLIKINPRLFKNIESLKVTQLADLIKALRDLYIELQPLDSGLFRTRYVKNEPVLNSPAVMLPSLLRMYAEKTGLSLEHLKEKLKECDLSEEFLNSISRPFYIQPVINMRRHDPSMFSVPTPQTKPPGNNN